MSITILIAANSSWYLYNFRSSLIRELRQRGYKVIAVAAKDEYSDNLACDEYARIPFSASSINPLTELSTLIRIFRIIPKIQPDVVLSYGPKINIYFGLACAIKAVPQISNISGIGIIKTKPPLIRSLFFWLYKVAFSRMQYTFFQNREDMGEFLNRHIVLSENCERVMGSGVDLEAFSFQELPPPDPVRIAFVGRLLKSKGLSNLLSAFAALRKQARNIELVIFGTANSNKADSIAPESFSDRDGITYKGHSHNIAEDLRQVHALCLPSYYGEGVPRSLIEALALGKIIITTDHAGCRDTVTPGVNGYLCRPADIWSLEKSLTDFLGDKDNWQHMSTSSRELAETLFDEKLILRRYNIRIEEMLNAKKSRLPSWLSRRPL